MRRAEEYVRIARRHRKIAATLPIAKYRQQFLASAERLETLARASREMTPQDFDEDEA